MHMLKNLGQVLGRYVTFNDIKGTGFQTDYDYYQHNVRYFSFTHVVMVSPWIIFNPPGAETGKFQAN